MPGQTADIIPFWNYLFTRRLHWMIDQKLVSHTVCPIKCMQLHIYFSSATVDRGDTLLVIKFWQYHSRKTISKMNSPIIRMRNDHKTNIGKCSSVSVRFSGWILGKQKVREERHLMMMWKLGWTCSALGVDGTHWNTMAAGVWPSSQQPLWHYPLPQKHTLII